VRDVDVKECPAKDHTKPSKLRAFYDTNGLKICERMKEHEIIGTRLIICDYEVNKML
jgi:hypothetical protein